MEEISSAVTTHELSSVHKQLKPEKQLKDISLTCRIDQDPCRHGDGAEQDGMGGVKCERE